MGETGKAWGVSYAARGRAAGRVVARSALKLLRDESGATAIEYGLIISCMFMAIVGSVSLFGEGVTGVFTFIGTSVEAAI